MAVSVFYKKIIRVAMTTVSYRRLSGMDGGKLSPQSGFAIFIKKNCFFSLKKINFGSNQKLLFHFKKAFWPQSASVNHILINGT